MVIVVVEAGNKSDALITANFALEQGREIFAVPGNIFAPKNRGPNRLIQNAAHPMLDPDEMLDVLNLPHIAQPCEARVVLPSNATEANLFDVLDHESMRVDEVLSQTGLPIDEVTSTLPMMELKGIVRQVSRYTVIREDLEDYNL